jgi:hypothetical protein
MDPMDHMIVRNLRYGTYALYVDDFLLFSDGKEQLHEMHRRIREFLYGSAYASPWQEPCLLVWRLACSPPMRGLRGPKVLRFRRRLRRLHADYNAGLIDIETVNQTVQAWIGHAMHGDTWRLREQIFDQLHSLPPPQTARHGSEPGPTPGLVVV